MADDGLLGYKVRDQLFPTEDQFFRANPTTAGVASETGEIVLNPYADASVNRDAVAKNEAFRLFLRDRKIKVPFDITDEQREAFAGTPYERDEGALRETIAARVYSGDPSARATREQRDWVKKLFKKPTIAEGE
jgi:hypothetical protein